MFIYTCFDLGSNNKCTDKSHKFYHNIVSISVPNALPIFVIWKSLNNTIFILRNLILLI